MVRSTAHRLRWIIAAISRSLWPSRWRVSIFVISTSVNADRGFGWFAIPAQWLSEVLWWQWVHAKINTVDSVTVDLKIPALCRQVILMLAWMIWQTESIHIPCFIEIEACFLCKALWRWFWVCSIQMHSWHRVWLDIPIWETGPSCQGVEQQECRSFTWLLPWAHCWMHPTKDLLMAFS